MPSQTESQVTVLHAKTRIELQLPADVVISAMGQEIKRLHDGMDAHDDRVEEQILRRLERDGLLREGLTAMDVRTRLDG
jgi:hypothetical protein